MCPHQWYLHEAGTASHLRMLTEGRLTLKDSLTACHPPSGVRTANGLYRFDELNIGRTTILNHSVLFNLSSDIFPTKKIKDLNPFFKVLIGN